MMQHCVPMQRRALLKLGFVSAAVLAAGGAAVGQLQPGVASDGRLTQSGRTIFAAVASAVLDASLPTEAAERDATLLAHLGRLDGAIGAFPSVTRDELSQLLAVLATAPGRWLLAGLQPAWREAGLADIQAALQSMRVSRLALRQQAYQALRDLTNAAYYADASAWPLLDYPGPQPV